MSVFALLVIAGIAAITAAASLGAGGPLFALARHVPGEDVTCHVVLFAGLTFAVVAWSLRDRARGETRAAFVTLGLVVGYAIVDELVQLFVPARTFSWIDLAASLIGVVTGALGAFVWSGRERAHRLD